MKQVWNWLMQAIDRVFLVEFARSRRKLGRSELVSAWRAASYKVNSYLGLPFIAAGVLTALTAHSLVMGFTTPISRRETLLLQAAGAAAFVLLCFYMDRRFKKHVSVPPALAPTESQEEKQLIFRFRAIAIGSIAVACLAAFLFHKAGLGSQ